MDCARLVNTFHLLAAALRCQVWFEWVPSKANVSDLPSRGLMDELSAVLKEALGAGADVRRTPFALPPFATLMQTLAAVDALVVARHRVTMISPGCCSTRGGQLRG